MNRSGGETILIVDDNEINRYTTSRILRQAGYLTIEAACGQEALAKARTHPDLVLLDVNLPDIDGFEVCRQLRGDPATSEIPIVHTSATFVSIDDRIQGLDVGADGYLTRPIEPRVLVATIRACLRARRAGIPTLHRPDIAVRHAGGASTGRALSEERDLELRARRRRQVMRAQGRLPLLIDDLSEGLTFGLRGAAKAFAGRGRVERARLRALVRAIRAG